MRKFEYDYLLDYVMGNLTPEEEREVAAYLDEHPDQAAEVRDLFELMADIALSQEPVELPEDAETSLLERIRASGTKVDTVPDSQATHQEAHSRTRQEDKVIKLSDVKKETSPQSSSEQTRANSNRWWMGLALAAAIAVFAYLSLQSRSPSIERQLASICQEQGASCEPILSESSTELGTLAKRSNNALYVVLSNDPPEGQVYQAWEIVDGRPQSLGIWETRVIDISQPLGIDSIFGITVEPPGGSPQPSSTPIVVVPLS